MRPEAHPDFVDIVHCLKAEACDFIIVGVSFDEAAADPVPANLGGEEVRCIGFDALLENKRATGRAKDVADAEALVEIRARRR